MLLKKKTKGLITHDMGVIANATRGVAVMYAGHKAEEGPVRRISFFFWI
jgi:ABC-type dipeptide/oligopeptide/nickel transport system ATPase component